MMFSAEQVVMLPRQIEVAMGQGKSTQIARREQALLLRVERHLRLTRSTATKFN